MKDLVVWLIHTPAGTIAYLSAIAAFIYPKGSRAHRLVGRYFIFSMLIMTISGSLAGYLKGTYNDVFLGLTVFYTVFTAWLASFHKDGKTNLLEYIALVWIITLGLVAYIYTSSESDTGVYSIWVSFAVIFAIGDIRNIYQRGLSGAHRIGRHLWRICFSLMWATLAFVDKIVKMAGSKVEEMSYAVIIPIVLILILMLYWLYRIFFRCDSYNQVR